MYDEAPEGTRPPGPVTGRYGYVEGVTQMTIPQDTTLSFAAGHAFALTASDAILNDPEAARRALNRSRAFAALVVMPVGGYFVVRWPEWSWMGLAGDHARSPVAIALGLCGYVAANELGYRHAASLIKQGRADEAIIRGLASLSFLALVTVLRWKHFRWRGTQAEREAGTAVDVLRDPDFLISVGVAGLVAGAAGLAVAARNLKDHG